MSNADSKPCRFTDREIREALQGKCSGEFRYGHPDCHRDADRVILAIGHGADGSVGVSIMGVCPWHAPMWTGARRIR